ncbi:SRPBCC family protein [Alienimonas sp. DA493]|uniref:SRPBCC family protein n=1 Tax=Alienimonas sp. DA493 TaxID=3373605 RepID=UPI0037543CB9
MSAPETVTVQTVVAAPPERVWDAWTDPAAIRQWNAASDDWHCPAATNDLRVGGEFTSRMEARDGSVGFDFKGTYAEVVPHELIVYTIEDDREVRIEFEPADGGTRVTETFVAESTHPVDMQRAGWQSILDRFKAYAESQSPT